MSQLRIVLSTVVVVLMFINILFITSGDGKRMRLPMLMRSPTVDCNFTTDVCGINQTLEHFEYLFNETAAIDGRLEFYQLAIKPDITPLHIGRFQTILFPNLAYSEGCVHVEYNVEGMNMFMFSVVQQTLDFPNQKIENHVVFSGWTFPSKGWNRIDIDVSMSGSGSQFAFEAYCEYCLGGSKFSVSRLMFSWSSCFQQNLPELVPFQLTFRNQTTEN